MMESAAGNSVVREGRKESWGEILRARLVRAVVLWPREEVKTVVTAALGAERQRRGVSSWEAGRRRDRRSMMFVGVVLRLCVCGAGGCHRWPFELADEARDFWECEIEDNLWGDWIDQTAAGLVAYVAAPWYQISTDCLSCCGFGI